MTRSLGDHILTPGRRVRDVLRDIVGVALMSAGVAIGTNALLGWVDETFAEARAEARLEDGLDDAS